MARQAFLFRVVESEGEHYIVKIARFVDYVVANVAWMDDDKLPAWDDYHQTGTLMPDIDITEEAHRFDTESEALIFIMKHYTEELKKITHKVYQD